MADKDTDNFEEEFNLAEEAEFEERPVTATATPEPPAFVRFLVTVALLSLIGYGLYKGVQFFRHRIKTALPSISSLVAKKEPPVPANPKTEPAATKETASHPEGEVSFEEISQAFSKADQTISPTTPLAPTVSETAKPAASTDTASIQNMQKDLFQGTAPQDGTGNAALIATSKEHTQKLQAQEAKQNALQTTLDRLNNQLEDNNQQIKRIETALNTLGRPLAQISREVKSLDGRIQTITDSLNTLVDDLNSLKKGLVDEGFELPNVSDARVATRKTKQNKAATPDTPVYTGPEYAIHAVVPGRAWLKSQKGQIITVTEGDTLGDFGKVLVIDAVNSTVMTSSGISFK